ncbi:MAG TPA: DUF1295 domain-containing protein [Anaerolineae bacterium]|nr:DUF1295 domain-containing protein [Anaerolineae bacterium]
MNGQNLFNALVIGMFVLAAGTGILLLFVVAPYGRHTRKGWGPTMDSRHGWVIMEAPAPLVFALCFVVGAYSDSLTAWAFFLMWEIHYVYRSFVYPLGLGVRDGRMPVVIAGLGFAFNGLNAFLNGWYLYTLSGGYRVTWLADPRFIIGFTLFVVGLLMNRQADRTLRYLRRPGESGYVIPRGGLYRWISCPNYLGEIVEWFGWAIATWSPSGLAFAVWTAANLAPRARSHHRWYREEFADYPPERRALLPGLW